MGYNLKNYVWESVKLGINSNKAHQNLNWTRSPNLKNPNNSDFNNKLQSLKNKVIEHKKEKPTIKLYGHIRYLEKAGLIN